MYWKAFIFSILSEPTLKTEAWLWRKALNSSSVFYTTYKSYAHQTHCNATCHVSLEKPEHKFGMRLFCCQTCHHINYYNSCHLSHVNVIVTIKIFMFDLYLLSNSSLLEALLLSVKQVVGAQSCGLLLTVGRHCLFSLFLCVYVCGVWVGDII